MLKHMIQLRNVADLTPGTCRALPVVAKVIRIKYGDPSGSIVRVDSK